MSWAAWLALGVAALAGAGAAAELACRAWLRRKRRYFVWPRHYLGRYEIDRAALPMLEPVARWSVNAVGERGDPLPRDLEHTYRVLVAGGSATECYFLDQESTWPDALQRLLERPESLAHLGARHAHVGNVGRSTTTVGDFGDVFERILPRYGCLDLVVLMTGASDVLRWLHVGMPAEWREDRLPAAKLYAEHPEGPFGWAPRRLALRRPLEAAWRRLGRPVDARERVGKRLTELRRMRAEARLVEEVPDLEPLLETWRRDLRRTLELVRPHARRLLFVPNPWFERERYDPEEVARFWNFGLGRPYEEHLDTYLALPVVSTIMRRVSEEGLAVARELECEVLDLMPLVPCTSENFYDLLHHTPAGNRRVAEEISRVVLGPGLSAPPPGRSPSP